MTDRCRVLGIEGTAWAASAAVYDAPPTDSSHDHRGEPATPVNTAPTDLTDVFIESDAYEPDNGGIHPREAAEHMHEAIPRVVERALEVANERAADAGASRDDPPVDAVAFSRGPGLGPCLRIVATAARAVSQTLDVPLVGVNHMVAHLEVGRADAGFRDPVCLNASGANAHLLAYRNGRYRVLGETMDTGVGNAIDKFTRHVGWSHPGGPKVEAAAVDGEYVDLPYVVKGMDFSFSGIMSAAKAAYDDGVSASGTSGGSSERRSDGVELEDVCFSLQETIFAMLTEVAERGLSLTGRDELVLGGGVGQNARLRDMLATMCEERGAAFHAPEPRFLRDNAGMIAVLGAKMYEAGDTLAIEDSRVDSDFRPDLVPVTWRDDGPASIRDHGDETVQGAEATVDLDPEGGRVIKRRAVKAYRHPNLDRRLRRERTRIEARLTSLARREGVPTPVIADVDPIEAVIEFQYVGDVDLRDGLTDERVRSVGRHLATIHGAGFVHGDPTTRNVRVDTATDSAGRTYLVDFGLGFHSDHVEDYAMDLHVFEQSLIGTAADPDPLRAAAREGYLAVGDERVLDRLRDIEGRGRYVDSS